MPRDTTDTVLVVCAEEDRAQEILGRLFDEGFSVVGPATDAKLALALAAQSLPTIALMAQPPTGRRDALQLAEALLERWGVRSLILAEARPADASAAAPPWTPRPGQAGRLRSALPADAEHGF